MSRRVPGGDPAVSTTRSSRERRLAHGAREVAMTNRQSDLNGLAKGFVERLNRHDAEALRDLLDRAYVNHNPYVSDAPGPDSAVGKNSFFWTFSGPCWFLLSAFMPHLRRLLRGMPRSVLVFLGCRSRVTSFASAARRLMRSPSISPCQPLCWASLMRSRRLCAISASRSRCRGSTRSMGQRMQA